MTAQLKPIPEEQNLTYWQVGVALEKLAAVLKDLPYSVMRNVEYQEEEAYHRIETTIKGVNNRVADLQKALDESDDATMTAIDAHYSKTYQAVQNLNDRLGKLPKIESGLHVGYGVETVIETAERLSRLTDQEFDRFIILVKALTGSQEKP
jgi:hypothetical protein